MIELTDLPRRRLLAAGLVTVLLLAGGCDSTTSPPASSPPASSSPGGPPSASAQTGATTVFLTVRDRRVPLHIPPGHRPAEPAPLLISLHGYTSSGFVQDAYLKLTRQSDERGFLYAYPDGTTDRRNNRFWNATDACCDFFRSNVDDVGFLRDLIAAASAAYGVDARRVYLIGHSNGAFMAYRAACDLAGQVAAIATLNGAMWQDAGRCKPAGPVSVLDIHSTGDQTIRYDGGQLNNVRYPSAQRTRAAWLTLNGCAANGSPAAALDLVVDLPGAETSVTRNTAGCAGASTVEAWTIEGGAHVPAFAPAFAPAVMDFLLSRRRP